MNEFCIGEAGHVYNIEYVTAVGNLDQLEHALRQFRDQPQELSIRLNKNHEGIKNAILAVPTDVDTHVLEAHSPFQAYCKLKSFFETVASRVILADPYMGAGLFHRYFNSLPDSVELVLVTKDRPQREYRDFLDVSRLYAAERGHTKYRLFVELDNHDRWLRCDDQLYLFGGSLKDAGMKSDFSISSMDSTPENFKKLDDLVAKGRELFGPAQTTHL